MRSNSPKNDGKQVQPYSSQPGGKEHKKSRFELDDKKLDIKEFSENYASTHAKYHKERQTYQSFHTEKKPVASSERESWL